MNEQLRETEKSLVLSLSQRTTEAQRLKIELESVNEKILALHRDLTGTRDQLLTEFLDEKLASRSLDYTLLTDNGDTFLNVSPIADASSQYEDFQQKTGYKDTTKVPLLYVLNFIGEGLPYSLSK